MKNSSQFLNKVKVAIALWLKNFLGIIVFQEAMDKRMKKLSEELYSELRKLASLTDVQTLRQDYERIEKLLTPEKVANPSLKKFDKFSVRVKYESLKDEVTLGVSRPMFSESDEYFAFGSASSFRFPELRPMSRGGDYVFLKDYVLTNEKGPKKIIEALYATNQVAVIHITSAFEIILRKPASISWDDVLPKIYKTLEEYFANLEEATVPAEESSTQGSQE